MEEPLELETLPIADLKRPGGLCIVGDALFVSDTGNRRVLRASLTIDPESPEISLEEPEQVCVLQQPQGLALLAPSTVLVADQLAHCVYAIDAENVHAKPRLVVGQFNFPGDGPKTLRSPAEICCFGNYLFIAEKDSSQIRLADLAAAEPGLVNVTYGRGYLDGPRPQADEPAGMFAYRNRNGLNLVFCDSKNSVVRVLVSGADCPSEQN